MPSPATLLLALAASASAHIRMTNPVPYNQASLTQDPLEPADYPCKQANGFTVTKQNAWPAGTKQTVTFQGTAVHGGGSCQFSITSDQKPSKDSQFKVIHQVIGGCPMDTPGNAPVAPSATWPVPGGFDVMMPADIPDGQYTFAWTWFNKLGNREFYMNCAPVTVTGGKGKDTSALAKLPDIFVANLPNVKNDPANACTTTEGQNIGFKPSDATGPGCGAQQKLGAGNGKLGSPSASAPSTSAPQSPSQKQPTKQDPPAQQPAKQDPPAAPQAPANNTPPASGCTPCQNEGGIVCMGGSAFGMCNHGCAVSQAVAAGTTCSNGAIVAARSVHLRHASFHARRSVHF